MPAAEGIPAHRQNHAQAPFPRYPRRIRQRWLRRQALDSASAIRLSLSRFPESAGRPTHIPLYCPYFTPFSTGPARRAPGPTTDGAGRLPSARKNLCPICKKSAVSLLRPPPPQTKHRHTQRGPFVYRLGRQVFNLKRGVRLPYGLPQLPSTSQTTAASKKVLRPSKPQGAWRGQMPKDERPT